MEAKFIALCQIIKTLQRVSKTVPYPISKHNIFLGEYYVGRYIYYKTFDHIKLSLNIIISLIVVVFNI